MTSQTTNLPPDRRPALRRFSRSELVKVNGKSVLVLLLLTIVATPFLENLALGMLIESVLISLVLGAGVVAVGGKRGTLLLALALALPAVIGKWASYVAPGASPPELHLVFAVLTVGYVAWKFVSYIMNARRVDSNVLCTGIAAFLLLAVLWAFVYQLVDRSIPGSFACTVGPQSTREMKGMFAFYFSLVTLCTVGFGDIVPVSEAARMFAMLEGATGVFFVAVLISRLVSLYTAERGAELGREAQGDDSPVPPNEGPGGPDR